MFSQIAFMIDAVLLAFAAGSTMWFFFVQSPVLLKWMGKEKFLPIQMRLTRTLFAALAVAVPLMFAMTLIHGSDVFWLHVATAGLAMLGTLVNAFVVVPRALRAGGQSLRDVRGTGDPGSVADFASRGGGEASKVWHRLVVVFVVVMLGGLAAHGWVLFTPPAC